MVVERFDDYMYRCLYGREGFYTSGRGVAGRRTGDFITSPEVGPLFGAVIARWLDVQWRALGEPDPFRVIDAGTGPGTLLRSLELAEPSCSSVWELIGVDPAAGTDLPADLDDAVVIANELLDNLVVRILVRSESGWLDVWVDTSGPQPIERLEPIPPSDVGRLPTSIASLATGTRCAWHDAAGAWVADVLGRGAATILAFDYGSPTTRALVDRGGWLRTYREHQRGHDPYVGVGTADITIDVAFDQLPSPTTLTTQADFLREQGIDELVADGARYWSEHAARPDLRAIMMRSRHSEAEALLAENGLGAWLAATWRAKLEPRGGGQWT